MPFPIEYRGAFIRLEDTMVCRQAALLFLLILGCYRRRTSWDTEMIDQWLEMSAVLPHSSDFLCFDFFLSSPTTLLISQMWAKDPECASHFASLCVKDGANELSGTLPGFSPRELFHQLFSEKESWHCRRCAFAAPVFVYKIKTQVRLFRNCDCPSFVVLEEAHVETLPRSHAMVV